MATFEAAFVEAQATAFEFLQAEGFHLAERRVRDDNTTGTFGLARYESQGRVAPLGWSISIYIEPYRLDLSLELSDDTGQEYSLEELYRLESAGPLPRRQHGLYESAGNPEVLGFEFERLAEAFRRVSRRFFQGDVTLWADLGEQRQQSMRDDEDRLALAASDRAFQAKDWAAVVRALEPLRDRLHGAAASRLSYARKRTAAT
jgi:hypothetical protein